MSVINLVDFHKQYGPGRAPVGLSNKTTPADVRVLTALIDYFAVRRCLEIGVNSGMTANAILAGNKTIEKYIGVDLMPGSTWYLEENETPGCYALSDPRFQLMQLPNGSRDLRPTQSEIENGVILPKEAMICPDFIFIDGAHDYASVKADTELAHLLIVPGGIIAWHDYQHPKNPDVARLIHEINDKPGVPEIVWVKGTWTAYKITAASEAAQQEVKSDEPAEQPAEPKKRKRSAKQSDAEPASSVA
jgi:hypothetical protein